MDYETNLIMKQISKNRVKSLSSQEKFILSTIEKGYGHKLSYITKSSFDNNENPIPWYTYPFIDFLNGIDLKKKTIFEYGSGNSSLYFARRSKSVTTIDDNEAWYEQVRRNNFKNLKCYYINPKEKYVNSVRNENKKYDLIIIDGVYRLACAEASIKYLKKGGFIILDNSDWYRKTAKYIRSKGFNQIDFSGFGPINYYSWTTSIFLNKDSNIEYLNERKHHKVKGGREVNLKNAE